MATTLPTADGPMGRRVSGGEVGGAHAPRGESRRASRGEGGFVGHECHSLRVLYNLERFMQRTATACAFPGGNPGGAEKPNFKLGRLV